MRKYGLTFIFPILLILTVILSACERGWSPATYKTCECEQLPDLLPLHIQMGKTFSKDELKDWISIMYGVSDDKIKENGDDLVWQVAGIEYTATLQKSMLVSGRSVNKNSQVPSAGCVVACWGNPDQYKTEYGVKAPVLEPVLNFEMLFFDLGIWAQGEQYFDISAKTPSMIANEFPIISFRVVMPGATEELLHQIYWGRQVPPEEIQMYKPWPDSWDGILINAD